MDTSFWGPDAWCLLHSIASACPDDVTKHRGTHLRRFFGTLPHVLPCVFCRDSLTDFYADSPVDVRSGKRLRYWLYRIHNRVNGKLRDQGAPTPADPPLRDVRVRYDALCRTCDARLTYPGWDFMYCLCLNYVPECRIAYRRFFTYLATALPYPHLRRLYRRHLTSHPIDSHLHDATQLLTWVHALQRTVAEDAGQPWQSLADTRRLYETHRARCDPRRRTCVGSSRRRSRRR
jgi:hypothetical protein